MAYHLHSYSYILKSFAIMNAYRLADQIRYNNNITHVRSYFLVMVFLILACLDKFLYNIKMAKHASSAARREVFCKFTNIKPSEESQLLAPIFLFARFHFNFHFISLPP